MARRRRGRKGGRKSKAIPVAPLLPIAYVGYRAATKDGGIPEKLGVFSVLTTGYDPRTNTFNVQAALPFWIGEVAAIVVHKVANKTVNRYIRKASMGYLSL